MSGMHLRQLWSSMRLYSLLRCGSASNLHHPLCSVYRSMCNDRGHRGVADQETDEKQENQLKQQKQGRKDSKYFRSSKREDFKLTKLHNRVMTEEEQEKENTHHHRLSALDESDTFGDHRTVQKVSVSELYTFNRRRDSDGYSESHSSGRSDQLSVSNRTVSTSQRSNNSRKRYSNRHSDTFGNLGGSEKEVGVESLVSEIGSHNERLTEDSLIIQTTVFIITKTDLNQKSSVLTKLLSVNLEKFQVLTENFIDDGGDKYGDHHIRLSTHNRRHSQIWYGLQIEKLGKKGKVKEAVSVLEDWMLKRDRVMPSQYTFTVLIGVLGRVGYTKKAFQLFNKMKKMGLQPEDHTYTALFNACANSPWPTDGLSRANRLRNLMQMKGIEPNLITYQAMMKAYGLHGDIKTAFVIMDELTQRYRPTAETFSFLLMACISDRKTGFKHAVEVWRLLKKYHVSPDLPLYNLLLRAVRDCGAGDAHFANQLLHVEPEEKRLVDGGQATHISVRTEEKKYIAGSGSLVPDVSTSVTSSPIDKSEVLSSDFPLTIHEDKVSHLPNLLDPNSNLSQVMSIGELNYPEDRLAVIGGVKGILESMEQDNARPDVRTFTQLIEVAPPTVIAEAELLAKMEVLGVKPDITLFNAVIHRRCLRRDSDAARSVLKLIASAHLHPNMQTFGCLAMTCRQKQDGMQLLEDIEQSGLSPNIEILGTLAHASTLDFGYKMAVLQHVESLDLKPNDKFIEAVERSIAKAKQKIVQVEKGLIVDNYISSNYFQSTFAKFMKHYKTWLHKTCPPEEIHPWKDFRQQKDEQIEART